MSVSFEGSIRSVWKTLGSYSARCLLLPVLVGYIYPGRISDKAFSVSVLSAAVGITYWRFSEHSGFWADVDELFIAAVILVGSSFSGGNQT